ncbi:hypothetical protein [Niveibacterium sp. SC-1]|uniref:ubiquinone biosynthesis accessory factor UbiJ n=1 Tax=Niveibacterium sp. SC-1 TaxID=3135646 RepID=UPI00311E2F3F
MTATPSLSSTAFAKLLSALLVRNAWALPRLTEFVGRSASLSAGPVSVSFELAEGGGVIAIPAPATPDVQLSLPAGALSQLPHGGEALMRQARISGDAHFAESLGFVLRKLEWDAEEDLARLLGDPLAHRLHSGVLGLFGWLRRTATNGGENLREYLIEEARISPPRVELEDFGRELAQLRDALARLEKRVERLAPKPRG